MHTKNILFFLLTIILMSCNENIEGKNKLNSKFKVLEEFLPKNLCKNDFIYCWRFGSIEWSNQTTLLIIPKKKAKYFDAYYVTLEVSYFIQKITTDKEYLKVYKLELENKSDIDFKNCLNYTSEKIDSIILDENYSNSEGRCANSYYLKEFGKDQIILINKNSNKKLKKFILLLFNQISAQEHFQSLSLYNNCEELDSLSSQLFNSGKIKIEDNYCIDFELIKHKKK